jgi:hypothetical protein
MSMWDAQPSQRHPRLFVPPHPKRAPGFVLDAAARLKASARWIPCGIGLSMFVIGPMSANGTPMNAEQCLLWGAKRTWPKMQRCEFIGLLGGDAASPFALAARKDGLGEEPCARSVLFCSVSQ